MKYYLIEIAEGDSKIQGKAMFDYETLEEAEANFHSKLGIAMKSDLYVSDTLFVINSELGRYPNLERKFTRNISTVAETENE